MSDGGKEERVRERGKNCRYYHNSLWHDFNGEENVVAERNY